MTVQKYIYDGDAVLQETDGAGVTQVTYTRTPGAFGDLLSEFDGTSAKYYEPDGLGSTDALSDQSQAVTDRWAYRAFGAAVHVTGTDPTPFTWVGRLGYFSDSDTGLYLLGNGTRYYDPATAQFLSKDPVGLAIHENEQHDGRKEPVGSHDGIHSDRESEVTTPIQPRRYEPQDQHDDRSAYCGNRNEHAMRCCKLRIQERE